MLLRFAAALSICLSSFVTTCLQAEKPDRRKDEGARKMKVSAALVKGFKVLATAVQNYPENRKCFSCHHQTLPLLAFSLRDRNLRRSIQFTNSVGTRGLIDFTTASFETRRPQLLDGTKIDGGALAVGYGLWAMEIAKEKPNETTNAMVQYLLKTQAEDGGWELDSVRPPASSSRAMATAVAYLGLIKYGINSSVDQAQVRTALTQAAKWSSTVEKPVDHEDLVGLMWLSYLVRNSNMGMRAMGYKEMEKEDVDGLPGVFGMEGGMGMGGMGMGGMGMGGMDGNFMLATHALSKQLRKSQREDGGWGQTNDLPSDAYATGMALLIDDQTASRYKVRTGLSWEERNEAIDFLLRTQEEDGSWHVASRTVPIRTFFDNGDPHGKDQFVSVMATSWAIAALASHRGNHRDPMDDSRSGPMVSEPKTQGSLTSLLK